MSMTIVHSYVSLPEGHMLMNIFNMYCMYVLYVCMILYFLLDFKG